MKKLLLIAALISPAHAQVPQCVNVTTNQRVDCYSQEKIDAAYLTLRNRGIKASKDYIVSIEMNRGKFVSAKALADWIERGDE